MIFRKSEMSQQERRLALEKSREVLNKASANMEELKEVVKGSSQAIEEAYKACVIFAQEEGGSGVCVSSDGLILTCAHCLRNPDKSRKKGRVRHYVIFTNGMVVLTESVYVDKVGDVALLKALDLPPSCVGKMPHTSLSKRYKKNETLYCVGQPYPFDLESEEDGGKKIFEQLISVSKGSLREILAGDILDNSEIGKMRHTCWTYWGHSGSPLLNREGLIVGIHSSWDDETCTRHGVALECLLHALEQYTANIE